MCSRASARLYTGPRPSHRSRRRRARPPQTSLRSTRLTPREARGHKRAIQHPARSRHRCRPNRRPRPRDPRLTSVKDSSRSRQGWRRRYYAVNSWRCTNSSLMFWQDQKEGGKAGDRAKANKRALDLNVWLQCYAVYVGVLGPKYPHEVPELMAYMISIIRASQEFEGSAWAATTQHTDGRLRRRAKRNGPVSTLPSMSSALLARPGGRTGATAASAPPTRFYFIYFFYFFFYFFYISKFMK